MKERSLLVPSNEPRSAGAQVAADADHTSHRKGKAHSPRLNAVLTRRKCGPWQYPHPATMSVATDSFVSLVSALSSTGTPPSLAVAAAANGGLRSQNEIEAMALASRAAAQKGQRRPAGGPLATVGANRAKAVVSRDVVRPTCINCDRSRPARNKKPMSEEVCELGIKS
jgi:hypothetical protein